jgi:hypothetical protein
LSTPPKLCADLRTLIVSTHECGWDRTVRGKIQAIYIIGNKYDYGTFIAEAIRAFSSSPVIFSLIMAAVVRRTLRRKETVVKEAEHGNISIVGRYKYDGFLTSSGRDCRFNRKPVALSIIAQRESLEGHEK